MTSEVALGSPGALMGETAAAKVPVAATAVFLAVLLGGLLFIGASIVGDLNGAGVSPELSLLLILCPALLIALGFEFVNGFHDTANAVATVIYTRSMAPLPAVIWSGLWNLIGVMVSTGAVAFSVVSLLPVELILQVGSSAGYDMLFALLLSAIFWNLATWSLGIPNSSSHALVGSIMGVGLANQIMSPTGSATSGVDWAQAAKVGQALLFSPLVGFVASGLLLLVLKLLIRNKTLYSEPTSNAPPPWWIRLTLIGTCTGVSFAHGGNDGQKGMGLIMLILIGVTPATYALNRGLTDTHGLTAATRAAEGVFASHSTSPPPVSIVAARDLLGDALRVKKIDKPEVFGALATVASDIEQQTEANGSLARVPADKVVALRNDMYLASEAMRMLDKEHNSLTKPQKAVLKTFKTKLDASTRFIPFWVKVAVAIALGFGTMVGWKRIVVTVGERIGKSHLTYAQGASAEMVAALTISAAEAYGLPVSTTHILSSGVAGTMAANGSGLQWPMVRSIISAWILTLPATITLSALLFYLFRQIP